MRKVALITDGWRRLFTYAWPAGILQRIQETGEDVNLYIFNSTGNWSRDAGYNRAEYNIYNLPELSDFDGIILELNNISSSAVLAEVISNAKRSGRPVVSIANELEDFYYVGIDNYSAMKQVIAHLHEVHDCKKFWLLVVMVLQQCYWIIHLKYTFLIIFMIQLVKLLLKKVKL